MVTAQSTAAAKRTSGKANWSQGERIDRGMDFLEKTPEPKRYCRKAVVCADCKKPVDDPACPWFRVSGFLMAVFTCARKEIAQHFHVPEDQAEQNLARFIRDAAQHAKPKRYVNIRIIPR